MFYLFSYDYYFVNVILKCSVANLNTFASIVKEKVNHSHKKYLK